MPKLRDYQHAAVSGIHTAWTEGHVPLLELPTGGGKTVILASIVQAHGGSSCVVAHRKELVQQISLALAREDVAHRVIAPRATVRAIVKLHTDEIGRSFYDPNADAGVAGVDSIHKADDRWRRRVTLIIQDEAHHLLAANKWGRALDRFTHPGLRILGVTATPERADGKGLGAHMDGVFTRIVRGPPMRELIDRGYLSEYMIYCPDSGIDLSSVTISKNTGDFSKPKLVAAMQESTITGDIVAHYLKHARGKRGVTFVTDVETAKSVAAAYRAGGAPALAVSAKTPPAERTQAIRKFSRGEVLQLVNVDLFGEGFDVPAIEVVSMARPTASYPVYAQQFGRALRILPGKSMAIIIDHVGNVMRHGGPPDFPRVTSLNGRERKTRGKKETVPPLRVCLGCTQPYSRDKWVCPYCGHPYEPAGRSTPEQVEGDLVALDPAVLRRLRKEAQAAMRSDAEVEAHYASQHIPAVAVATNVKRHRQSREAQEQLRDAIAVWAGVERDAGASDRESYRKFFRLFGIDVLRAQALRAKEAMALLEQVQKEIPA